MHSNSCQTLKPMRPTTRIAANEDGDTFDGHPLVLTGPGGEYQKRYTPRLDATKTISQRLTQARNAGAMWGICVGVAFGLAWGLILAMVVAR